MTRSLTFFGFGLFGAIAIAALWFTSGHLIYADALKPTKPDTIWIDQMTWPEVREAVKAGHTQIIVPFGGTEQGGLHLVLGKHNHIIKAAVNRAARELGQTLATPVMPFAPEGKFDPPDGNMSWPGTLGLRPTTFMAVAEDLATSLKLHGFKQIFFVADHGLSIAPLNTLAAKLNKAWSKDGVRVHHIAAYYLKNGQTAWLKQQGHDERTIGYHAGMKDTSELLLIHPSGVRDDRLFGPDLRFREDIGTNGDPSKANRKIGQKMMDLKVAALIKAIQAASRK